MEMVAPCDDDSFDNFIPDSRNIPTHSTPLPGASPNLSFAEAQRPSSSILSLGKPLKLTIELYHRPNEFASKTFVGPHFSVTTNWATGIQNTSNIVISDNNYQPGKITIEFDEQDSTLDADPKSDGDSENEQKDSDMDVDSDDNQQEEDDNQEKESDMDVDSDDNEEDDDEEEEEESDKADSESENSTSEDSDDSDDSDDSPSEASESRVIQYGAGTAHRPIPPPELEEFVPNMNFPSDEEIEYLHRFVVFRDATSERINNRLVQTKNNGIRLCKLDQIEGMSIEQHVEKVFDIFIRRMLQQVKGSLETTIYWIRLRHFGETTAEFHVNHRTYAKGNGHVLLNSLTINRVRILGYCTKTTSDWYCEG